MKDELIYTIPGWGFSADIFNHGALADNTCFGMNYFNYSDMSIEDIALQLSNAITKPGTIVAWSLGGLFAIKIASLFPDKVKKLILLASQPKLLAEIGHSGIDPKTIQVFIKSACQDFSQLKKKFISEVNFPNKNFLYRNSLNTYFLDNFSGQLKDLSKFFSADLRDEYSHLRKEILHIIGGKDAVLKQNEQCLRKTNSNITVVHIAEAGHGGFLTHAKLYRSVMDEFIDA
ncbi:MAG: bioH [Gammaproteobacteria bacterium]|jgi:pimeloyl-[acyl-carrier protein] methyl ester esterase|nr:bioH [Gammaproteobacteria bacterium]